ncbi:3-hydroxybenzoate 6-hydroxylase [Cytospora mali]|uniref:3-hydroxybenzoate 6-hydroxylase n=1 Tax=Cytospora mali TaxID=578113 RepID=A0A194UXB8_CYTMA|nr:3-hydroxybenzoate 6-hydroxylase [Valsa mali var. pyri (nom. inval.)]
MTVNSNGNGQASPAKLKVAIVGGGPGGLATAIALSKIPDVQVQIYEKDKVLREVGAGINIGPNSWNVLELLGVADSLVSGHQCNVVLNMNGRSGAELHQNQRPGDPEWPAGEWRVRPTIRTQRTKLQSALLAHVGPGVIQLSKKLDQIVDLGAKGVELKFADGTTERADLVVGADGIRSIVRDSAWPDYQIAFTGTTIWRALLPLEDLTTQDARFGHTGWWHLPNSHVYFSPVGEGLGEIATREYQDPAVHSASKVVWGVPVTNEHVEGHFKEFLPQIQAALKKVRDGEWREFAAFAGPELDQLSAWDSKVVLVGDSSHALSGAFGSGAGFAMEDGWVLAQALRHYGNDVGKAVALFNRVRVPYYHRMYEHLAGEAEKRKTRLRELELSTGGLTEDDRVKVKVIKEGKDMSWIYQNNIGKVWESALSELGEEKGQ